MWLLITNFAIFISERELYAVARPSVVCLSVMLVRRTQAVEIFGNISSAFGTYPGHPLTSTEHFTEIVPGEPSVGGVKHKRGSKI